MIQLAVIAAAAPAPFDYHIFLESSPRHRACPVREPLGKRDRDHAAARDMREAADTEPVAFPMPSSSTDLPRPGALHTQPVEGGVFASRVPISSWIQVVNGQVTDGDPGGAGRIEKAFMLADVPGGLAGRRVLCPRRLISRFPCFPGGSGVACGQEVTLVYLRVNDIKIPAALDLGGA